MSIKTTFGLLLLLVALGGVWMFTTSRDKAAQQAALNDQLNENAGADENPPIFASAPKADDIRTIKVERAGMPTMAFRRVEKPAGEESPGSEDWEMTEPVVAPAQGWMVSEWSRAVLEGRVAADASAGGNAPSESEAGLAPPAAIITLTDSANKPWRLEIGRKVPLNQETYIRRSGEKAILVVDRDLSRDLKKPAADYRTRQLLSLKPAEVVRAMTTIGGQTIDLSKTGDGWSLESPVKTAAQTDKVTQWINNLSYLNVADFVADAPPSLKPYGFEQPFQTIRLTVQPAAPAPKVDPTGSAPAAGPESLPAPREIELLIGAPADSAGDKRFAKRGDQPWVVSLNKADIERLAPKLTELRDARVTRVAASEVQKLAITVGDQTAALEYREGRWQGEGDLAQLELSAVADLLEAFEQVRAIDYAPIGGDSAKLGLDAPRAKLVASTRDDRTVSLKIGAYTESGRNCYVQRNDDAEAVIIAQSLAERLVVPPLSLRSRAIFDEPSLQVSAIRVNQDRMSYELSAGATPATWTLVKPENAPLDPAAAMALANDLSRLRGKRVVARAPSSEFDFSSPLATLEYTVTPPPPASAPTSSATDSQPAIAAVPPRVHKLTLIRKAGATYAIADDSPYIFELDSSLAQTMTGELLVRKILTLAVEDIASIAVKQAGSSFELKRGEKDWQYTQDPYVKIDKAKADELANAIAGLSADAFLAWAGADFATLSANADAATIVVTKKDGTAINLALTTAAARGDAHIAAWPDQGRVFLLRPLDAEKLTHKIEHYLQSDAAPPAGGMPPPSMPQPFPG